MKIDIKVPSAGESVTEATVAQILKPSGSFVKKEEEILELETDKVNQVIHAPDTGILTLSVSVNDKVTIDQVIGSVDTEGKGEALEQKKEEVTPPPPPQKSPQEGSARNTPENFVKSLAKEPLKEEMPSPKKEEPFKEAPKKEEKSQTRTRMSGLRRIVAKKLVEVKNQTAMLTTFNEVDMTKVMEIRKKEGPDFLKKHGVKLGFMSFFVKAVTSALKAIPSVNAFIEGEEIVQNHSYHIGLAVSTEKGLMVPVVKNCDALTFADIEKSLKDFALKARDGKIAIDDLQGGSFTITNGGVFGSLLSTPILNPPQSAILGMHAIVKRPIAIDDQVEIRPMMYLALSYDHRNVDGKEAVTFLVHLKENLEDPERLMLDF
ncbi:MAG: dihydrolipoyllysine-residue succinyltransferase [Simkaniaceae bacterium]|nr:dihydrolipoyllysine-residue succinyltransferase [Simkaniaceae bacterium]